ncbi:MAG: RNA methyltransferase, partial [Bacteroidetes bacterium]
SLNKKIPVYGTLLEGENIYTANLSKNGIIIIGNEGKGISEDINSYITNRLFIPDFNTKNKSAESLNVSVAAAIVCSEFKRRK